MRHSFLDRYSRLDSPMHSLPAPVKLVAAVILLVSIVILPVSFPGVLAMILTLLVIVALVSSIPLIFLLKRMLFLEMFVVGVSVLSLFQKNGVDIFTALCVKSTLCLFTIVLFSNTTPFSELLAVLKKWGAPALFITILALLYRYLFVLVDELERMQRARASRTFVARRWALWRMLATVVGQLFVRSTERAERIYAAMCSRGWQ